MERIWIAGNAGSGETTLANEPNWGCWHFNHDSSTLAKKLGFEEIENRRVLILQK